MLNRGALALAAAALLVAAPAMARNFGEDRGATSDVARMNEINDLQVRCNQLMSQFDAAAKGRAATAALGAARKLRTEAGNDCLAPMDVDVAQSGVAKITQALNKIGVTPQKEG